ncbi:DNA polymerase IV [Gilvimarinus algae]|uniref:DNA polymerase IV n=1 Tax=Gilvimarinus algae TaxID=3058037 RepID=A0ABT8TFA9_9GAMM|nr:DNA polymerase IV [Gilvimarinus sp. SDUM040014]MDO3382786.1 DNA polymerase IV [Gilvimarinus sp. SDUM040014]
MSRIIMHVDADCFFAAVEMREQPLFRHRPMAVGGSADRRGVISTCNYPARVFGVRSAMASAHALRLCPGLTILPHRMNLYRETSSRMMDVFQRYTDRFEPLSLDEAYLDLTGICSDEAQAVELAARIRAEVTAELGITVSVGLAPNKFLAKVASEWEKPDGLFFVRAHQADTFVRGLSVTQIPGVGRVTAEQLQFMGIGRCDQLQAWPLDALTERFGRFGHRLYWFSRGVDEREVQVTRERKSISVEQTYSRDLTGESACLQQLPELLSRLEERLAKLTGKPQVRKGFVKVKFGDFSSTTIERPGEHWRLSDYQPLLSQALTRGPARVRLLGLGVRLAPPATPEEVEQMPLFH